MPWAMKPFCPDNSAESTITCLIRIGTTLSSQQPPMYAERLLPPHRITESQSHSIVEMGRDLSLNSLCQIRVIYSRLTRTSSSWGLISLEKETPQPLWAAWARALSPSEGRSSSSCSGGTSQASVCAHCPLSCCWALLKRVWPRAPDTHPADI